jgi:RNA polymerase sigma factor (sigma-70 family)
MMADRFVNASQEPDGQGQPSAPALRLTLYARAARDGDAAAFERLVELTQGIVRAIAVAVLRDADLGADVAQDVFLAAWRGIRDLRYPERVLPWLRQLTRNRAREMLRMRLRQGGHVYPRRAGVDDLITMVPDPGPSPVDAIIAAEDRAAKSATLSAMTAAIASLPATSRQVLLLHYGARRSAPEVARQLDVSADAVRQRLARARARLRAALDTTALGSDARSAPHLAARR